MVFRELYFAIVREEERARLREESRHRFPFLQLPAELRNQIYEYTAYGLVLTQNLLDAAVPCMCRYAMIDGKLFDYDAGPHPLLQVCRQTRYEFIPFLSGDCTITNRRAAAVTDYNFGPLLEHLRRHPALQFPCQLEVQLRFTENGAENWHSLLYWIQMCQFDDEKMVHLIHGSKYDIKFLPDPSFTDQSRKRNENRLTQFSNEISEWDFEFSMEKSFLMECMIQMAFEL